MAETQARKRNTSIPGQVWAAGIDRICEIANSLPERAIIVETGCLYGRSSWHWAQNAPASAQVFCIDPWVRERWIIDKIEKKFNCEEFSLTAFLFYTRDCTNIVPIIGRSPHIVRGWQLPIDVYFDDSVHTNPGFRSNIRHWVRFVKPGGWLCGDDYAESFPDILSEVSQLASELGVEVLVHGNMWSLQMP